VLSSLTLYGGYGGNTFNVSSTPGVEFGGGIFLATGTGEDTVFVLDTSVPLWVDVQGGLDDVHVGGGGSRQGITADLSIGNRLGSSGVYLYDGADSVGRNVPLGDSAVTGLATRNIYSATGGPVLSSLAVYGGYGGNTFTVSGTPGLMP